MDRSSTFAGSRQSRAPQSPWALTARTKPSVSQSLPLQEPPFCTLAQPPQPVHWPSRSMTTLEALIGQLYPAVLLARLVTLYQK